MFLDVELFSLPRKCDKLKKRHELLITRKMGIGDAFPRKFLCVKKSALGVGLIETKTFIEYLAIK